MLHCIDNSLLGEDEQENDLQLMHVSHFAQGVREDTPTLWVMRAA